MGLSRRCLFGIVWYALAVCTPLHSQSSTAPAIPAANYGSVRAAASTPEDSDLSQPPATLEAALHAAFADADVVFAGEVLSIVHAPDAVIIRWRVDKAVRGVTAGEIFQQKEWAGLWVDGNQRYRAGERALMLLHAPSAAGYVSPLEDGVLSLQGDAVTGTVDLRWLAQHVAVRDSARLRPRMALRAANGDIAFGNVLLQRAAEAEALARPRTIPRQPAWTAAEAGSGTIILSPGEMPSSPGDPNARVDGAMILDMLDAWRRSGSIAQ